jgi:hypothetical protein
MSTRRWKEGNYDVGKSIALIHQRIVVIGGVMVIVLAIGPKARWFKPGRQPWIFKGDRIRGMTSSAGQEKPSAPSRKA